MLSHHSPLMNVSRNKVTYCLLVPFDKISPPIPERQICKFLAAKCMHYGRRSRIPKTRKLLFARAGHLALSMLELAPESKESSVCLSAASDEVQSNL